MAILPSAGSSFGNPLYNLQQPYITHNPSPQTAFHLTPTPTPHLVLTLSSLQPPLWPPLNPPHIPQEFDDEDHDVRHSFLGLFAESGADMYLYLDTSVYITRDTITKLVDLQKPLVSPMLKKNDGTAWSNFWGGYDLLSWSYTRSGDYDNIFSESVSVRS
eukprot:sb/3472890/